MTYARSALDRSRRAALCAPVRPAARRPPVSAARRSRKVPAPSGRPIVSSVAQPRPVLGAPARGLGASAQIPVRSNRLSERSGRIFHRRALTFALSAEEVERGGAILIAEVDDHRIPVVLDPGVAPLVPVQLDPGLRAPVGRRGPVTRRRQHCSGWRRRGEQSALIESALWPPERTGQAGRRRTTTEPHLSPRGSPTTSEWGTGPKFLPTSPPPSRSVRSDTIRRRAGGRPYVFSSPRAIRESLLSDFHWVPAIVHAVENIFPALEFLEKHS